MTQKNTYALYFHVFNFSSLKFHFSFLCYDVSMWGGEVFPPANDSAQVRESTAEHSDWTPSRPEKVTNADKP